MSYSMDERLPKDYFKSVIEEKAEMLRKYCEGYRQSFSVFNSYQTQYGGMVAFKFYLHMKRKIPSNYISPSLI